LKRNCFRLAIRDAVAGRQLQDALGKDSSFSFARAAKGSPNPRGSARFNAPALPKLPESPQFWMPRPVSTVAGEIDWLFDVMVWISVICALLILGAMIHFCIKYRAGSRAANERTELSTDHNTTLEITWSVLPLIVVVLLFIWGFKG
jgi:Cytochrome C oxidase subunit II, transmembrane domain